MNKVSSSREPRFEVPAGGSMFAGAEADRGEEAAPLVVVLIRARDEERFIASRVLTALRYASHVVVVDEASTDRTAELAEAAGATLVPTSRQVGAAAAMAAGMKVARSLRADVVVCFGGEAPRETSEVLTLVRPILDNLADVVIGSPGDAVPFVAANTGWADWATSMSLPSWWSGDHVGERSGGHHAYSATAVNVLHVVATGTLSGTDFDATQHLSTLRVTEVALRIDSDGRRESTAPASRRSAIERLLLLVTKRRPLLLVGLPGALLSVVGILLGIWVSYRFGQVGELMVGTAILTVLLVVGGLVLSATGVMLHSLEHFVDRLRETMSDVSLARRAGR